MKKSLIYRMLFILVCQVLVGDIFSISSRKFGVKDKRGVVASHTMYHADITVHINNYYDRDIAILFFYNMSCICATFTYNRKHQVVI